MSINNTNKLVEEFKKSGEFDRIRRELLAEFQDGKDLTAFKSRIEDVARQRLTNDHNLLYMPQEFIHRELMQELDRFPVVERSTSELPTLNDPTFSARISGCLEKLLQDHGILVKTKQLDQEKPHDDTQRPDALSCSKEEDKDARSAAFEEETKQIQTPGAEQDASETSRGKVTSAMKIQDSDSMDVDED